MSYSKRQYKNVYLFLKRFIDFSGALFGLIFLTPILIVLFILVWITVGWPVFFTQDRPGQYGKPFKMIKFRTMTNDRDELGCLLSDHLRTTLLGRFIRKTSLDELPEFFNVLKGDMSIVGPRPLLEKYLPYYSEREMVRHIVKPGITGLAQVSGRNLLTWDNRLELDVQYVEKMSFCLDSKIIFRTVLNVISQKDVLAVSSETIPDFDSYRKEQLTLNKLDN